MRAIAVVLMLVLGGCTGIVLGRAGPGRGVITLTNVTQTSAQAMNNVGTQHTLGPTHHTYVAAFQAGPSTISLNDASESGFGLDAYAQFLYNTPSFFGFGGRAGFTTVGNSDDSATKLSYTGFPIMVEAAIGTRMPGPVDTERKVLGSISGLALSAHGSVGYVASGTIKLATAPATPLATVPASASA